MDPFPGHWDDGGKADWLIQPGSREVHPFGALGEELLAAEAGVAFTAVGVQDPQRRSPPWWTGAIARDDHLRSLADDVAPEPDPRSTGELETDPRRFADRTFEAAGAVWWLEHDERDPRPPRECGHACEAIAESRFGAAGTRSCGSMCGRLAAGQVDDEQVDGPTCEQRAGDGQALLGIVRSQDDEPFRLDPAGHRLDGIERGREIQPRHDRPGGLGLRDESQGQRGSAARDVTAHREPHPARHAARPEDRIELGEAGRMDAVGVARRSRGRSEVRRLERDRRKRADHLAGKSGRRRTPARAKGREGRGEIRRGSGHVVSIEHMFE
jgi:hypothetical protein